MFSSEESDESTHMLKNQVVILAVGAITMLLWMRNAPLSYQATVTKCTPGVHWFLTSSLLASQSPTLFALAAVPHAAMSALALLSGHSHNALLQQLCYYPACASAAAWMVRPYVPPVGMGAALASAALFVASGALGVVKTMLYPAPIVSSLINMGEAHRAMSFDKSFVRIDVPLLGNKEVMLDGVLVLPTGEIVHKAPKYMLYIGGNGELIEGTYPGLQSMANLFGVTVVMVNPMGVGRSAGVTRNVADLVLSARSAVAYLQARHSSNDDAVDIVVFGHSIGGGIASELVAKHHPTFGLILDRTFSSLYDAAIALSPIQAPAVSKIVLDIANFGDMENIANFKTIPHAKKLILFHLRDQVIRFSTCSIARPEVMCEALETYLMELDSTTVDIHNCPISDFKKSAMIKQRVDRMFGKQ